MYFSYNFETAGPIGLKFGGWVVAGMDSGLNTAKG
jgi:hypothetical protein